MMPQAPRMAEIEELVEGTEAHRVDTVLKPANGMPFLLLKAEAPEATEEPLSEVQAAMLASKRAGARLDALLKDRQDGPHSDVNDTVPHTTQDSPVGKFASGGPSGSSSGTSPGSGQAEVDAILGALLKEAEEVLAVTEELLELALTKAEASYDEWCKGKYSADEKRELLKAGKAMRNASGEPSYPIEDADDLAKAIKAVGRGGASHNSVRKFIMRRAKALGKSEMVPENWQSDGSLAKAAPEYLEMQAPPPVNGSVPDNDADGDGDQLAAPDDGVPGSSAWEAEDARRLIAAGQIIAQLCNDIKASMAREQAEVYAGETDDVQDVSALDDATCALEYALGVVAKLAFREEAAALTKASALPDQAEDTIRRAISLLKSGELGDVYQQPAPEGSGQTEEVWDVGVLTKEDLAAVLGEAVAPLTERLGALEKAEADRQERKKKAEKKARKAEKAEAPAQLEKSEPEKAEGEDAPDTEAAPADISALIKGAMEEVITPLTERLSALEGTPAAGGPLVGPRASGFRPMAPRGGDTEAGATPEIQGLRGQIQKAEADGDQITEGRLRKELGRRLLEQAWAGMGYSTAPTRGSAAQYTENVAAV